MSFDARASGTTSYSCGTCNCATGECRNRGRFVQLTYPGDAPSYYCATNSSEIIVDLPWPKQPFFAGAAAPLPLEPPPRLPILPSLRFREYARRRV